MHSSYLYIGSWFIEGLGGIRYPESPSPRRFVVEPCFDGRHGPRQVKAHHDSLYGRIATEWSLQDQRLRLRVTVPANTEAELRLRQVNPASVKESSQGLNQAKGIAVLPGDPTSAILRLEAGQYDFEALVP